MHSNHGLLKTHLKALICCFLYLNSSLTMNTMHVNISVLIRIVKWILVQNFAQNCTWVATLSWKLPKIRPKEYHFMNYLYRCTRFRFGPLQENQIVPRLEHVATTENVNVTEDGKKALIALSGGDMRKVRANKSNSWAKHLNKGSLLINEWFCPYSIVVFKCLCTEVVLSKMTFSKSPWQTL